MMKRQYQTSRAPILGLTHFLAKFGLPRGRLQLLHVMVDGWSTRQPSRLPSHCLLTIHIMFHVSTTTPFPHHLVHVSICIVHVVASGVATWCCCVGFHYFIKTSECNNSLIWCPFFKPFLLLERYQRALCHGMFFLSNLETVKFLLLFLNFVGNGAQRLPGIKIKVIISCFSAYDLKWFWIAQNRDQ